MTPDGKPPVPDPRTGMDAPDDVLDRIDGDFDRFVAYGFPDAEDRKFVRDGGRWMRHLMLAEVRRLRAEADEVYELAHKRPVPSSIASMLCNMTERHRLQGGRS